MEEIWKPVLGYEGYYEVSNLGEIKSLNRATSRDGFSVNISSRIMATSSNGSGYMTCMLSRKSERKRKTVHSMVLEAFWGERPVGMQASHVNGIKSDNRISNLCWESPVDNNARKQEHGTVYRPIGERNGRAEITEEIARLVKSVYVPYKFTQKMIAEEYGISYRIVRAITSGKSWKHVNY